MALGVPQAKDALEDDHFPAALNCAVLFVTDAGVADRHALRALVPRTHGPVGLKVISNV